MATELQDRSTEALPAWHARSAAEVAQALGTDPDRGLSSAEAVQRLAQHGPNLLAEERREPRWTELVESLTEPLQLLLIAVGVIYALLGELEDALTILAVILTVAIVEALSEARARGAIAALRTLSAPTATVLREGTAVEIAAAEVVPGDVVLLEAGDRVVADLRLVETVALRLDESSLTGESVPVAKDAAAAPPPETELDDRRTMAFAGTTLTAGKGRGLVVATGRTTELGRIAGLTESARDPGTPLQVQMKQLAGWLVWVALASSLLVPVLGVFVAGRPVQEMLLTGLTLAFATIPEELPILITIVLGLGAYRLAQEGAIVKRLRAAEALGSVSTIGTDKTGTLTENRMRLAEVFVPDGTTQPLPGESSPTAASRVLEIAVLASDAQAQHRDGRVDFVGDPTETALLAAAEDSGLTVATVRSAAHILEEYPFDDARGCLSVVVEREGQRWLLLKGAPESVLAICSREGQAAALDQARQGAEAMAARGLRVLGFAERRLTPQEPLPEDAAAVEHDLVFVGLAGLADPPRPEVPAAVAALKAAGVRVLMLTGDHPATARAIAEKVGIDAAQVLRARDLDQFSEVELRQVVADTSLFARITPEHKLRLVRALQERGDVVAVTGDGVNDGPALREAAVGVAMGKAGTDVAREAADLVLADDNFATVTTAVRGGRTLYANLRKAVRYYLAAKVALVTASLVAVAAHLPVPFEPVQIIVLELFMDLGASTTFVSEPPEEDLMARPPRDPRRAFMDHPMQVGILAGGLSLAAAVVVPYLWAWRQGGDLVQAQTAAFVAWMLGHLVLAAHLRAERQPLLRTNPLGNRPFLVWAAAAVALVALGLGVPSIEARLHLAPLTASTWAVALASAVLFPSWCEAWKWARRGAGVRS
jgi:P-type Ca2+ transporter type 2C